MRGALATFVKTPGLSSVKSRLAAGIGEAKAAEFYELAVRAMAELMHKVSADSPLSLTPYWAVAEQAALALPRWQEFTCVDQQNGTLGERLHHVYACLRERYDFVIFLGADCPQLSSRDLLTGVEAIVAKPQFVLGPAADGGFWLFAGRMPLPAALWSAVPYSADNTAIELATRLTAFAPVHWLSRHVDCDHASDLVHLRNALQDAGPHLLSSQHRLLAWLTELC